MMLFMKKGICRMLLVMVRVLILLAVVLLIFQRRLIYHPRSYSKELMSATNAKPMHYRTSDGDQVAWLMNEHVPDAQIVWLVTCGNGTCALDLVNYFDGVPELAGDVFVFVDYPGYGASQGNASPESIRESLRALVPAVTNRLHQSENQLKPRLRVMGHSLGAAAALMAMEEHGIKRGVLIAPFTSMHDMARRVVGWPLCCTLHHCFDNVSALSRLHRRGDCHLEVLHGTLDEVIPYSQGRALAEAFPDELSFEPAEGALHNQILDTHRRSIIAAMLRARQ
jgi:pimeloyl-ACP methyl ester carboxylesterase